MTRSADEHARQAIGEMDDEHALQKQVLEELQETVESGDREGARRLFERLEDVTNAHFLGEQILMRRHAYPAYDDHQQEHDRLLDELRELGRAVLEGETTGTADAVRRLTAWFRTHVRTTDAVLTEYLRRSSGLPT